jgi:hypothetical protein
MLPEKIEVRCDNCGEEYSYKRKEVVRDEVQVPENFVPHPLFKQRGQRRHAVLCRGRHEIHNARNARIGDKKSDANVSQFPTIHWDFVQT